MESFEISKNMVCNLSKIPTPIIRNPLYQSLMLGDRYTLSLGKIDTLADLYNIQHPILEKYSSDVLFLPWIHNKPVIQYRDYFFKTMNDKTLVKEKILKLRNLQKSIKKHGYCPDKYPTRQNGITGYYLVHDRKRKFYVVSGNHRVAVLSFLDMKIPVLFDRKEFLKARDIINTNLGKEYPNEFNTRDVYKWPSVKSGFLNKELAIQITEKYFE